LLENLELIEQGKAGPPREIDELSTRVKQEPVTPVKQQRQVQTQVVHQQLQPQLICKQEAVVMVKTEPEISVTDVNTFDPSLPNLAMQVCFYLVTVTY
jgi:hypothetical protein